MRKSLGHQESTLSLEHHPGCMWGILHHLNHHRWHNVKKKLPHRRHSSRKHSSDADAGSSKLGHGNGERRENSDSDMDNSVIEAKAVESGSVHKSSMKSRIKAMIVEEMSKRRGRHRRSSSCPSRTPLARTTSIHHLESADINSRAEIALHVETLGNEDNVHSSTLSLIDPSLPKVHGEAVACDLCAAMLTMNYLKQSEVNGKGKQPVKDHTLLRDHSIYAIEPSKTALLQESKLFLDALDLLNMRQELFLKVLRDPNSSLAHQLHGKRLSKLRVGLTKSESFPISGPSGGRQIRLSDAKCKLEHSYCANGGNQMKLGDEAQNSCTYASTEESNDHSTTLGQCQEDSSAEELQRRLEPVDNDSPVSPPHLKSRHENKFVIKRFKNLGEKIKHAIKESRKERRRIIMDAVLHKIPHGRKSSKECKGQIESHEKRAETDNKNIPGSSGTQDMRRTSSFNESIDKYNRLLELDLSKEGKIHNSEGVRQTTIYTPSPVRSSPKRLGRILSLPDLRLYHSLQIEESPDPTLDSISSVGSSRFGEQKHLEPSSGMENKTQLDTICERESLESFADVAESFNDSSDPNLAKNASCVDLIQELTITPQPEEPILNPAHDSNYKNDKTGTSEDLVEDAELVKMQRLADQEDSLADQQSELGTDSSTKAESIVELDIVEASSKKFYDDIFQIQVVNKNKAEFDYVKDVLELSGFSTYEFLGRWHSAGQPVDPSVFDEVELNLNAQPDFYEYEDVSCDHLLLFDLINEVLLDIYGKSSSYWPMPLTRRCHIHPMPIGHHVLEEVWTNISCYLRWKPEADQLLDDAVSQDLAKADGWMNLQFDAECVGLELEELIVDDLLYEIITDLS